MVHLILTPILKHQQTNEQTDVQTDDHTDGQTDGQTDVHTDEHTDGHHQCINQSCLCDPSIKLLFVVLHP